MERRLAPPQTHTSKDLYRMGIMGTAVATQRQNVKLISNDKIYKLNDILLYFLPFQLAAPSADCLLFIIYCNIMLLFFTCVSCSTISFARQH